MEFQNVGFLAKTLTLASPRAVDLQNAWRGLSARGSAVITCAPAEVGATLLAAEQAGFFGMRLEEGRILAWKGKEGPCYDTGRTARYLGSAAAVMDDDKHLLFGQLRVCEKTARLYSSEAYQGRIEVSEPDAGLIARLEKDPAPFDCDTFETDARTLASTLSPKVAGGDRAVVLYPGPFKMLILADGTIVRRGLPVRLPVDQARTLRERDGALADPPGDPIDPPNYSDLYRIQGAAFLLGELGASRPARPADLDAIDELPESMKRRLQAVISRGDDYFILTGSDPAQKDGCCPSNEVGIANLLVDRGILASRGELANSECPVTLYAFASEIASGTGKPEFLRNAALRDAVRRRIEAGPRLSRKAVARLALLAVLAAAVVALAYAVYRQVILQG
jgi:hypothetical protein